MYRLFINFVILVFLLVLTSTISGCCPKQDNTNNRMVRINKLVKKCGKLAKLTGGISGNVGRGEGKEIVCSIVYDLSKVYKGILYSYTEEEVKVMLQALERHIKLTKEKQ